MFLLTVTLCQKVNNEEKIRPNHPNDWKTAIPQRTASTDAVLAQLPNDVSK